ncbi:extracellular solute-binding protein [Bifidobacterium avesanii]|uniref:Extracellular solute-binding protein n=1 Tax=Bifidobacterium avesanii TaxID=1798157 RepID=A0A7K3TJ02_9BIFI|nr:extracellular solute-binding protein [Bifidobacterium avesanii]KAB8291960.1 ABC transporter substrate-binding protein [Bifidobacterium avesanii]NEG79061.1 extracellular solute-binding protein [Bifidobacterium avesanii]
MKINWKKAVGLAAAVAMLSPLAACGSSTGSGSGSTGSASGGATDVTLKVWSPQADQASTSGDSWLTTVEKAFEKAHPEYKITWTNDVVGEDDASKTVKQDAASAADVYMFGNDQLGTLIDAKAIGQLGTDAEKQVKEQSDEATLQSVTSTDGKLYGVPYTGNTWFMYYNKSKFSADDVKSLDAMLAKGKVAFQIGGPWYYTAFYTGAGAKFFGSNGMTASDGIKLGDKATDVTKYLAELANNPNFVVDDGTTGIAGLQNGTVDAYFDGTWNASKAKAALGDNYAAAPAPSFTINGESIPMTPFSGSKAAAYNPNSKNAKAAAQFAAFLGSTDSQKSHYTMSGVTPSDKSLASIATDPASKAQMDTIAKIAVTQPIISAMNNFWDPATTFGNGLKNKDVTAANAADKLAEFQSQLDAAVK